MMVNSVGCVAVVALLIGTVVEIALKFSLIPVALFFVIVVEASLQRFDAVMLMVVAFLCYILLRTMNLLAARDPRYAMYILVTVLSIVLSMYSMKFVVEGISAEFHVSIFEYKFVLMMLAMLAITTFLNQRMEALLIDVSMELSKLCLMIRSLARIAFVAGLVMKGNAICIMMALLLPGIIVCTSKIRQLAIIVELCYYVSGLVIVWS